MKYYGPDQYLKATGELKKFLKLEEADEKLDVWILETQLNAETNRCVSEDTAWNAVSLMRRGEGVVKAWQDQYKVCWPESVVDDDESMSEFKYWLLENDVEDDVILMVASSETEKETYDTRFVRLCVEKNNISLLDEMSIIKHPCLKNLMSDRLCVHNEEFKKDDDMISKCMYYLNSKYSQFIECVDGGVLGNKDAGTWFFSKINPSTVKHDIKALEFVLSNKPGHNSWKKELQKQLERFALNLDGESLEKSLPVRAL